jgi:hypothetical protein
MTNTRSLINRGLSTAFTVCLLAASLPAVNSQVITPFEAFVLTPLLVMLAGLGGVATCRGLERVELWVHRAG